jgi:hypothetical protein
MTQTQRKASGNQTRSPVSNFFLMAELVLIPKQLLLQRGIINHLSQEIAASAIFMQHNLSMILIKMKISNYLSSLKPPETAYLKHLGKACKLKVDRPIFSED